MSTSRAHWLTIVGIGEDGLTGLGDDARRQELIARGTNRARIYTPARAAELMLDNLLSVANGAGS